MSSPIFTALADIECNTCSLMIRKGDDVMLGEFSWVHPLCGAIDTPSAAINEAPREGQR